MRRIKTGAVLWLAASLAFSMTWKHAVNAQEIDHADVDMIDGKERLTLYFTWPVQWIYATPDSPSKVILVGIKTMPRGMPQEPRRTLTRHISIPPSRFIDQVEIVKEPDFDAYILIDFNETLNYKVSQGSDFRSIIVDIEKNTGKSTPPDTGGLKK